jgi:hypothetical protein
VRSSGEEALSNLISKIINYFGIFLECEFYEEVFDRIVFIGIFLKGEFYEEVFERIVFVGCFVRLSEERARGYWVY